MTVSSSTNTIKKIELTFGSGEGSNTITVNTGEYANGTWEVSASSVVFTVGGTSGHRRIASVAVTYAAVAVTGVFSVLPVTPTVPAAVTIAARQTAAKYLCFMVDSPSLEFPFCIRMFRHGMFSRKPSFAAGMPSAQLRQGQHFQHKPYHIHHKHVAK